MKPLFLVLGGFALMMAGCHKHAPVASTPKAPDTTPVAAAPAPTPPPARPPATRPLHRHRRRNRLRRLRVPP